jgi:hypothetical protein
MLIKKQQKRPNIVEKKPKKNTVKKRGKLESDTNSVSGGVAVG